MVFDHAGASFRDMQMFIVRVSQVGAVRDVLKGGLVLVEKNIEQYRVACGLEKVTI